MSGIYVIDVALKLGNNDREPVKQGLQRTSGPTISAIPKPYSMPPTPGWQATLNIAAARRGDKSALTQRSHTGPLYIQRALYPEADHTAHVMILHPPGGLVQGDQIDIQARAGAEAALLITTPSAGKFYKTPAGGTAQNVRLAAEPGARLEWLPQEAILFDGAHVTLGLTADLDAASRAIVWDSVVFGRPAIGERLQQGSLDSQLRVTLDGQLIFSERTRVPGLSASPLQDAAWGLDGAIAMGTLVAYCPEGFTEQHTRALRETLVAEGGRCAVTRVDALLVVRALGRSTAYVRQVLIQAWQTLRPWVMDKPAVAPRIWST